jgi:ubiquinone/menaquinone biosynthesis C-methylase UbiE
VTEQTGSISFDRAAGYYDRTRALPADLARRQTELLVSEIGGRHPVVELGIGTGRIALPLVAAGMPVMGLDLSRSMMERLRHNAGAADAVGLVEGDATRLPFAGGAVGAVLIVHVLHLVPAWRDVVAETARVLQPGGLLLVERGGPRGLRSEVEQHFWASVGRERHPRPVPDDELDAVAAELGMAVAELDEVRGAVEVDVGGLVDGYERRVYSSVWPLDDDEVRIGVDAMRRWVRATYGEDRPTVRTDWALSWRRYSRPAPG